MAKVGAWFPLLGIPVEIPMLETKNKRHLPPRKSTRCLALYFNRTEIYVRVSLN